jgi:low temperature requirement protein LtrA
MFGTLVVVLAVMASRVVMGGFEMAGRWAFHATSPTFELVASAAYLITAVIYLWADRSETRQDGIFRILATKNIVIATALLASTGGMYGMFAHLDALFPSLDRIDPYFATMVTMSVLLLIGMIPRRRNRH